MNYQHNQIYKSNIQIGPQLLYIFVIYKRVEYSWSTESHRSRREKHFVSLCKKKKKRKKKRMRPQIVLFGDSITQRSFRSGGWGAAVADIYSRKVSSFYLLPTFSSKILGFTILSVCLLIWACVKIRTPGVCRLMWCSVVMVGTTPGGLCSCCTIFSRW